MNKRQIAEEELKRALLMMKYDSRKTLTENIDEQIGRGGAAAIGAGTGAATGAAIAAATAAPAGTTGLMALPTGAAAIVPTVASTLGVGTVAATAVVGGAVGLAVLPLAYWLITKDSNSERVKKLIQMCSTDATKIAKLERKIDDGTIRDLSDQIYDALNDLGTDEEKLFGAFKSLSDGTAADACALVNRFNKENGDLFEWLDDDIDDSSEWDQIFRPLRNCVEDSLLALEKMNPCKEGEIYDEKEKKCVPVKVQPSPDGGKKTGGGGGKGSYKTCSGTYTQGCKSEIIKKVQGCLGLVADGKFGPKTQSSLVSKGYKSGFTDADVDKICNKVQTAPETPAKPNPYSNWSSEEPEGGTNINQPAEG
jgi:hypothetical protein